VKICFPNSATEADFSELRRLERRFGADVAVRIATRIGVLMAARHLADVPTKPPIRLRAFDTQTGQFTVDLGGSKRLRLGALKAYAQKNGRVVCETVERIEVLGVD
jgi:hypothetical protein